MAVECMVADARELARIEAFRSSVDEYWSKILDVGKRPHKTMSCGTEQDLTT